MKKILSFAIVLLLGLIILPNSIFAKQYDNLITLPVDEAQQLEIEATLLEDDNLENENISGEVLGAVVEDVSLGSDEDQGPHFYFGEDVVVNDDLVGDVYVSGGTVIVNGRIEGDLLVAGGTVTLNGEVSDDVRAAGGTVFVNGTIGKNLTVAGGEIVFNSNAKVGNSIVAAGGEVSLDGETLGRVYLAGGATKLAGLYSSDVNVQADTIKVFPGVVVSGSLIADAGTSADVPDEIQVSGEKIVTITSREEREKFSKEKMSSVGGILVKATLLEFFMKLSMAIISGGLAIYFLPKLMKDLSSSILETPLSNFGWGLVYLFTTPFVIFLSLISIVAIPIAGVITFVYLISMIVSQWAVAYGIGVKLAKNLNIKALEGKYLGFAVGMLILKAVGFVPILGHVITVFTFFIGFGAIFNLIRVNILTKNKK